MPPTTIVTVAVHGNIRPVAMVSSPPPAPHATARPTAAVTVRRRRLVQSPIFPYYMVPLTTGRRRPLVPNCARTVFPDHPYILWPPTQYKIIIICIARPRVDPVSGDTRAALVQTRPTIIIIILLLLLLLFPVNTVMRITDMQCVYCILKGSNGIRIGIIY